VGSEPSRGEQVWPFALGSSAEPWSRGAALRRAATLPKSLKESWAAHKSLNGTETRRERCTLPFSKLTKRGFGNLLTWFSD